MNQSKPEPTSKIIAGHEPKTGFHRCACGWECSEGNDCQAEYAAHVAQLPAQAVQPDVQTEETFCVECGQVRGHQNHWAPFGWHNFSEPEPAAPEHSIDREQQARIAECNFWRGRGIPDSVIDWRIDRIKEGKIC
jgi:hypothetical protein